MKFARPMRGIAAATTILTAAVPLAWTIAAQGATPAEAKLQDAWRETIKQTAVPHEGCFKAAFPSTAWTEIACATAPARPYVPRRGRAGRTVGNGNDYAAVTSTRTSSAVGSFPVVTGVKSEKGYGGAANTYSLQLNSGFMTTAGCNGSTNSSCQTWQQFVYSSSETAAFMQYWLINYGSKCPGGRRLVVVFGELLQEQRGCHGAADRYNPARQP